MRCRKRAFSLSPANAEQTKEETLYGIFQQCSRRTANARHRSLGGLMLIVFGCIIFTIMQHTWTSMAILIVMEVFLILITAGTGVIEGVLQMASESLGGFMRS